MNLNELLALTLSWLLVLFVLSYRMLYAKPEHQNKYSEVIGNLILVALITIFLTAVTG